MGFNLAFKGLIYYSHWELVYIVHVITRPWIGDPGFDSRRGQEIIILSETSRQAMESTDFSAEGYGVLFSGR
jgi:hypothetical protein